MRRVLVYSLTTGLAADRAVREEVKLLAAAVEATQRDEVVIMLTGHQHSAVEMTRLATDDGVNPDTRELAGRIKASRGEQIAQMLRLMNS